MVCRRRWQIFRFFVLLLAHCLSSKLFFLPKQRPAFARSLMSLLVLLSPAGHSSLLLLVYKQGKRNPKKFLLIPAGDVHATDVDPPPASELLSLVSLKYLQGNNDTCLRDSLASALESMGFVAEGQVVAADATLVGCNLDLVQRAAAVVQRVFQKANLQMKKLYNHACSVSQVSRLDAAWPIVLLIQTSDCH